MATTSIISDRFRIFNAENFINAIGDDFYDEEGNLVEEPTTPEEERHTMYFFVGRPQTWYPTVEVYAKTPNIPNAAGGTSSWSHVAPGDTVTSSPDGVTPDTQFTATIVEVYEDYLLLNPTNLGGDANLNSKPTLGNFLIVSSTNPDADGVTARTGLYRFANEDNQAPDSWDNEKEFTEVYDDIIAAKRMTLAYTRQVVRRYNWPIATPEVYDMYRPDLSPSDNGQGQPSELGATSLGTSKFYVMNQDYEVFKCLYNGSADGIAAPTASVQPTTGGSGVDIDSGNYYGASGNNGIFVEDRSGDDAILKGAFTNEAYMLSPATGYVWKYLFTLPINDVLRFLSTDFMPVATTAGAQSNRGSTESKAVDGGIFSYFIKSAPSSLANGADYFAPVSGDGSGALVRFRLAGGSITEVALITVGSGYTYGYIPMIAGQTVGGVPTGLYTNSTLTIAAGDAVLAAGGVDTGVIEPIMSPRGGHGAADATPFPNNEKNIERELNAKRVMTNIRLSYNEGEGDFPVDNDFRRIGILKDPASNTNASDGGLNPAEANTLNNLGKLIVAVPTATYVPDELITQDLGSGATAKARVVSVYTLTSGGDAGKQVLTYYQSFAEHQDFGVVRGFDGLAGTPVVGASSGESNLIDGTAAASAGNELSITGFTNGVAGSEFVDETGDILYQENRRLITRAIDQIEDIKLVIEF